MVEELILLAIYQQKIDKWQWVQCMDLVIKVVIKDKNLNGKLEHPQITHGDKDHRLIIIPGIL